jgi:hypothetical protein
MAIVALGIDLTKNVFALYVVDAAQTVRREAMRQLEDLPGWVSGRPLRP